MGFAEVVIVVLVVVIVLLFLLSRAARPLSGTSPAVSTDTRPADEVLAIEARAVRDASGAIAAVKHVRQRTRWGLAEAKRYVDGLD